MKQSEVSIYVQGDGVPRIPLRRAEVVRPKLSLVVPRKEIVLREYQEEATKSCLVDLEWHRSSLIVLATGLGKTILFCKLIQEWPGRVLVLAHLEELLQNAREDLLAITGEEVGIERSKDHHEGERIVVGLIQSVSRRLRHFRPEHFTLIIVDEAHHAASEAYHRVFEHFRDAKIVGLTATDSRADGEPLPFESRSYRMGIREGTNEGYLVPIRGRRVIIEGINLTRVARKADGEGDFDDQALDDEMVKGASAIADVLVQDYPFDKGILFFPGCASAKLTSELLNERMPGCCVYIDGNITGQQRRELVRKLREGEAQWLCNVGIATEGFNWPEASIVGMCSPTLSRPAYVQRAGRGTRPLAGLLNGLSDADSRKQAIAQSAKSSMLILDFVGVSANLDLISHESFLDDSEREEPSPESDDTFEEEPEDTFEEEEDTFEVGPNINLRALAQGIRSKTVHSYDDFDPFEASGERHPAVDLRKSELGREPSISYKQYKLLCKYKIDDQSLTKAEAQKLVGYVASKNFKLWAPELGVLANLYRDIKKERKQEEEGFL